MSARVRRTPKSGGFNNHVSEQKVELLTFGSNESIMWKANHYSGAWQVLSRVVRLVQGLCWRFRSALEVMKRRRRKRGKGRRGENNFQAALCIF